MKRILVILLLIFISIATQAQPLSMPALKNKKSSVYFLLTGGALVNLNNKDDVQPATRFLKVNNTTGYKVGIDMLLMARRTKPVFLNVGLEYRHTPHRYTLQYGTAASGLGSDLSRDIKFKVHSVALRLAPVYTIPLTGRSNIDISAGVMFDAAIFANKAYTEEGLYVRDNATGYDQLAVFRFTGHGTDNDTRSLPGSADVGFNFMYYGSVSYRVSPPFMGERLIRIGAEYGNIAKGNRVSQTTVLYMDKNRNIVARDWVSDKGTYISLFLGVSI